MATTLSIAQTVIGVQRVQVSNVCYEETRMTQRVAVLIDGESINESRALGWELDYRRVLKLANKGNVGRADGGVARNVIVARVYLEGRDAAGERWLRFTSFLQSQGYGTCLCDEGGVEVHMVHDLLVYALSGRIDVAVLVRGDGSSFSPGLGKAIRTVRAHAVQVETWAQGTVPERHTQMTRFRDLEDSGLLRAARRP